MTQPRRALTRVQLNNFRNYRTAELDLSARPVVLIGPNGAGKTNFIEAVSCLAPGRGLRRATTEDLRRRAPGEESDEAAGPWAVSVHLNADGETKRIGVGQDPSGPSRRIVRIDGETATQTELGRMVRVVWLTPAQDRLFAGPRGERLRFFDRLTLALAGDHGTNANAYERAMRERSRLLEDGRADAAWLDGLEREMAQRGAAMAVARADMLQRLQTAIDARPDGAFPKADLALSGALEEALAGGEDAQLVESDFQHELRDKRRRDAAAGRALSGPHRSDLVAVHRVKGLAASDCSTGEQKALLVGLALAHARALEDAARAAGPLLLLDEAVAHLDADRRAALAEEIAALAGQAWLTGTDRDLFAPFSDIAQFIRVADGCAEAD